MNVIDPLQIITEYTKRTYNIDDNVQVIFGACMRESAEAANDPEIDPPCGGATRFGDDGSVVITVDAELPFMMFCEVYCHELAHVVCGIDEDHGEKWQKVFDDIYSSSVDIYAAKALEVAEKFSIELIEGESDDSQPSD